MTYRRWTAGVLTAAFGTGAALTGGSPAQADESLAKAATAHVLAKVGRFADVVTTDQGISVAMWTATQDRTRLEWAVKRPGKPWTTPRIKADWAVSPYTHGLPRLTTSAGHGVTATWLDRRRRVVVEDWSPSRGWSQPTHLSGRHHVGEDLRIISNDAGKVAVSWGSAKVGGGSNPLVAMVGVRREGDWLVRNLGPKATTSGYPKGPIALGMDGQGAVSAAWYDVTPTADAHAMASRLAADETTWETPQDFGLVSEYFNQPYIGLSVQPDGAEMINPHLWPDDEFGVFTRVGSGTWTDQGDLPFVNDSWTTSSGSLVTRMNLDVFEDSDGISGPSPFANLGRPDYSETIEAPRIDVTSDGTLVAISPQRHALVYSVRAPAGEWSSRYTVVTTVRQIKLVWSSSMSSDGRVAVVYGTKPAGSRPNAPLRVEAARFDATPDTAVAR
jgi:hypothetical protein